MSGQEADGRRQMTEQLKAPQLNMLRPDTVILPYRAGIPRGRQGSKRRLVFDTGCRWRHTDDTVMLFC